MVTVCRKCGDPEFSVALIYCYKCQQAAEHRYCLDVIPETLTEYVKWFCEDCKPEDPVKDDVKISTLYLERRIHPCKSSKGRKLNSKKEEGVAISPTGAQCNVHSYKNLCTKPSKQDMDGTTFMGSSSEVFKSDAFVLSQPVYDPVWSGCFEICVGYFGIVDGIAAHLSTKASLQVYKEAQFLPESLCTALVPRLNIWPKGFIKSGPRDENIGLYFFPQSKRYGKEYETLVDHMFDHDLAMRAVGVNADLFIFTSLELPLNNWKVKILEDRLATPLKTEVCAEENEAIKSREFS